MDTHIATRPEIQIDDAEENSQDANTDRVSALRTVDAKERLAPGTPVRGPRPKRRRNGLMITAGSFVVLVAAGGVFWVSPYHYSFADARRLATQARSMALNNIGGMRTPPPLAPAAQLARAPEPTPVPPPYRAPPPMNLAAEGGDDMAEFLKLGGQLPAPAPATATATPPITPLATPDVEVSKTATAEPKPIVVATAAPTVLPKLQVTDVAPPSAATPAPVGLAKPEPVSLKVPTPPPAAPGHLVESAAVADPVFPPAAPPTPPKDPVAAISALRAAPMTDTQQLQVLDLVTQLGTLVRDQRLEIAELKSNQQSLAQRVDSSLTDFGRRISLAEAHGAVNAAMGVSVHPADPPNAPAPNQNGSGDVVQVVAGTPAMPLSAAPNVSADTGAHRYHVQAASPGLAMLSELDASGGEERQLPVSPGDTVPGWGKVISIAQRGTSWFVKTDHGLIQ
jgi:hypothetical protein